jgi:putative flippase GtrA
MRRKVNTWHIQGLRYIIVGLASNLVLYLLYLLFTAVGIGHKTAMTLLYVIGTLQTFVFNKRWTFEHDGNIRKSMIRYFIAYGACYFLNLALLYILVDNLGWPHALVQGLAILLVAALLFLVQKHWVFIHDNDQSIQARETA